MGKLIIQTSEAPSAIGTYSQGVKVNNLVYTSGQIPINPNSGKLIDGDFKSEVRQVLKNVDAVLKEGGSSLINAVKLTVFLVDLSNFNQVNEVFNEFFSTNPPARSAVQVSGLPMNSNIEIEGIGYVE